MKIKSLLLLSLAVVLTSCKMEEIQDNISVSGYWAQLNSVSQAKSFIRFDKGLFYTYSLREALTVVDGEVWPVGGTNRSYGFAVRCQKE